MPLNDWTDGSAGGTPLSAERLNERDAAIAALQTALAAFDAADITDATTVGRNVLKAADAAAARSAIGAGTSSLAIGTSGSTAAAGNRALTAGAVTAVNALTAIATADATDEATAITLANATKAKVNAIITALKTA